MPYEDSNRELRIRQRSLYKTAHMVLVAISIQFATLGLVLSGMAPAMTLTGYSILWIFVGIFMVKSVDEGTLSRKLYSWYSDNPAPTHEVDVLKERAKDKAVTDGGDREDG